MTPSAGAQPASSAATRLFRVAATVTQLARQRIDPLGRSLPAPESLLPFCQKHCGALVRSLGIDVVTSGELPDPQRPLLVASNHVSWIDPYILNSVVGARFVAKHDVEQWPMVGSVARRFGSFFHKRGCFRDAWRTVEATRAALQQGYRVGIFPEATTSDGLSLRPFFPALFEAAVGSATDVQPVAIRYVTTDGEHNRAAAWDGEMSFATSVANYLRAHKIVAEVRFGTPIEPKPNRRELALTTEASIAALLFPDQPTAMAPNRRPHWDDLAHLKE